MHSRTVLASATTFGLLLVAHVQWTSAQLVGCDVVGCPDAGVVGPACNVGNISAWEIGVTTLNTTVSSQPLTWTVADSTTQSPTGVELTKSFYIGTPPSLGLQSARSFTGCALFFEGITTNLSFNGSDKDLAVGTCGGAMGSRCVSDLLAQAKKQLSVLTGTPGGNSSVCAQLQSALQNTAPATCTNATKGSWGNITSQELTGPNAAPIVPQGKCHPTTGANYDISLVESVSFSSSVNIDYLVDPWNFGVTPVMTLFYSTGSGSAGASGNLTQPEVQLSCLKTVGSSGGGSPAHGSAVTLQLPRGVMMLAMLIGMVLLY